MAYYLFQANYRPEAIKALVAEPQDREAAARAAIEAIGGTLHSFLLPLVTVTSLPLSKSLTIRPWRLGPL